MKERKRNILFIDTAHAILKEQLQLDGFVCDDFVGKGKTDLIDIIPNYFGIVIRSKVRMDSDILDAAKQLRFIARVGAGMENIDVNYAEDKGIACLHAPEGNRNAVAEHALGMLLMLFNKLGKADSEVRQGIWLREENRGIELEGKTIGIVGFGNTGGAFAKILRGFDVEVLAYDKYKFGFSDEFVREATMTELFNKADILSLHLPLTAETNKLVDSRYINQFKKDIFLINTSRGQIVRTADVVSSLESGKITGACLDVLEYEGLSFENLENNLLPEDFSKLVKMKNVVLSPHIAGWTNESSYKMAMVLVTKIRALLMENG